MNTLDAYENDARAVVASAKRYNWYFLEDLLLQLRPFLPAGYDCCLEVGRGLVLYRKSGEKVAGAVKQRLSYYAEGVRAALFITEGRIRQQGALRLLGVKP